MNKYRLEKNIDIYGRPLTILPPCLLYTWVADAAPSSESEVVNLTNKCPRSGCTVQSTNRPLQYLLPSKYL